MKKPEVTFTYRIQRILSSEGFLVGNFTNRQLFDMVAIKDQVAFPIELKAKNTKYPKDQRKRQKEEAKKANTCFFVIKQKDRGKVSVHAKNQTCNQDKHMLESLKDALGKYVEN